jgi:hypothetical protein
MSYEQPGKEIEKPAQEPPNPEVVKFIRKHGVPIAGALSILLLWCLVNHYSSVTIDWSRTKDVTDGFRNVTQGLAFIAGGFWAYFKFVKGRTFKESLIPGVTGKFTSINNVNYLLVTIQIKNVGASKIEIDHRSALIILEYTTSPSTELHSVDDKRAGAFDVFNKSEKYIEPNEIIEAQRLIAMPTPLKIAYRLEVEVASKKGYTWRANYIVDKGTLNDKIPSAFVALWWGQQMTPNKHIIIERRSGWDGEYKKYPSNQEELQQNERDKETQRARDDRAKAQAENQNARTANTGR